MEITEELFQKALILSQSMHEGQKYGTHDYFSYHVMGVLNLLENPTTLEKIVAVLHDVVEDTECSEFDIGRIFGSTVYGAVAAITKDATETYNQYIARLSRNRTAINVKKADSKFNLLECVKSNQFKRAEKYLNNLKRLEKLDE